MLTAEYQSEVENMELVIKEPDQGKLSVHISGEFTFSDNSKFREMLEQVSLKKPGMVSVDMAETDFIDSAGLGMLLLLKEKADQLSAEVEILKLSRFQDLFEFRSAAT